jgi:hypothetical protein
LNFICPTCGAKFQSQAAYTQHNADKHGGPRPGKKSRKRPNFIKGRTRFQGGQPAQPGMDLQVPSNVVVDKQSLTQHRDTLLSIVKGQEGVGLTEDGCEFFLRHCHPMGESEYGPCRIPDASTDSTAALEGRVAYNIGSPPGLAASDTWNCDIYVLPVPELGFIYRVWKEGTSPAPWFVGVPQTAFKPGSLGLNDFVNPVSTLPSLEGLCDQWRSVYSGVTVDLEAAAINDAGTVFAGRYGNKAGDSNPGITDAQGNIAMVDAKSFDLLKDENELWQKVPGAYEAPARNGSYITIPFIDPVQLWRSQELGTIVSEASPPTFGYQTHKPIMLASQGNTAGNAFVVDAVDQSTGIPDPTKANLLTISGTDAMQTGIMMYRRLYPNASLRVRTRLGLEAVPSAESPWQPFTDQVSDLDELAVRRATQVQRKLATAYPASYNSLSSIWNAIKGALKTISPILGPVADVIGGLGIPVVSDIAGMIGQFVPR